MRLSWVAAALCLAGLTRGQTMCASFKCTTGSLKDNAATIECGEGKPPCSDGLCCNPPTIKCPAYTCVSADMVKKANEATIDCGASLADCNDAKCCGVRCTKHKCGAGTPKVNVADIECGVDIASCNDGLCCDAPGVKCPAYTCVSADMVKKANEATIDCGASLADCNDAKCCGVRCNKHKCGAGTPKTNVADIECGVDIASCNDGLCCDAPGVKCTAYTCVSADMVKKANEAAITCGANLADCNDAKCCGVRCTKHKCGAGTPKVNVADIECGVDIASCNDGLCCDAPGVKCPAYTCVSADTVKKAGEAAITCGANLADCNDAKCCGVRCTKHKCGAGTPKTNVADIECGVDIASCNDGLCCDAPGVKCPAYTCVSADTVKKAGEAAITCGANLADCNDAKCCGVRCTKHKCGAGTPKTNVADIECGVDIASCNDGLCCDAPGVKCPAYTCVSADTVKKAGEAAITCGANLADCNDAKCCGVRCNKHKCGVGKPKANVADIECGVDVASCNDGLCCDIIKCPAYTCVSADMVKKANEATIDCGASLADCNDAKCCGVRCTKHKCGAGTPKVNVADIECGVDIASCNDGLCCDEPVVMCSAYGCQNADTIRRSNANELRCGTQISECTDAKCCVVKCRRHKCSAGNLKPGNDAIDCGDTIATCTDALCCDLPVVTCAVYPCKTPHAVHKPASVQIVCGSLLSQCNDPLCCEVKCSQFTCPIGAPKGNAAEVVCGATIGACNDDLCCDAPFKCVAHTCSFAEALRKDGVNCGALITDCNDDKCCTVPCTKHPCVNGYVNRPDYVTRQCGPVLASCTDDACCVAPFTCQAHVCPPPLVLKAKPAELNCGLTAEMCNNEKCCALRCNPHYACSVGWTWKANALDIECPTVDVASCNNEVCCTPPVAQITCEAYRCKTPGRLLRDNKAEVHCGAVAADCNDAKCCVVTCDDVATCAKGKLKTNAAAIGCTGTEASSCDILRCCDPPDVFNEDKGWTEHDCRRCPSEEIAVEGMYDLNTCKDKCRAFDQEKWSENNACHAIEYSAKFQTCKLHPHCGGEDGSDLLKEIQFCETDVYFNMRWKHTQQPAAALNCENLPMDHAEKDPRLCASVFVTNVKCTTMDELIAYARKFKDLSCDEHWEPCIYDILCESGQSNTPECTAYCARRKAWRFATPAPPTPAPVLTCKSHTCTAPGVMRDESAECGTLAGSCSDPKCCIVKCNSYKCAAGWPKAAGATIDCGTTLAWCTDVLCCEPPTALPTTASPPTNAPPWGYCYEGYVGVCAPAHTHTHTHNVTPPFPLHTHTITTACAAVPYRCEAKEGCS